MSLKVIVIVKAIRHLDGCFGVGGNNKCMKPFSAAKFRNLHRLRFKLIIKIIRRGLKYSFIVRLTVSILYRCGSTSDGLRAFVGTQIYTVTQNCSQSPAITCNYPQLPRKMNDTQLYMITRNYP